MSIYKTVKECDKSEVFPNEEFNVNIELYAKPGPYIKGTDSVLILDSSGSMLENGIEEMKKAACHYVDIIAENSSLDHCKNMKDSSIAVVGFSDIAHPILTLSKNVGEIKNAICSLKAKGYTNHADAFRVAYEIMKKSQNPNKAAILFTDGNSTVDGNIEENRKKLLSLGTEIYTGALKINSSIKYNVVKSWASEIKEDHFFLIKNKDEMYSAFEKIAGNISNDCTRDINIDERISPDFEIVRVHIPAKGTAALIDKRNINWKIDLLGEKESERAALSFDVKYTGSKSGRFLVNEKITYTDLEKSKVTFPSLSIIVKENSDTDISYEEHCTEPVRVVADGCQDVISVDENEAILQSQGRMVYVSVRIKNVCPHKRVALGVILTEVDRSGKEEQRGLKTILIPAHSENCCRDVYVNCIKFAVPEEISPARENLSICGERTFNVRTTANYIDSDYIPCK